MKEKELDLEANFKSLKELHGSDIWKCWGRVIILAVLQPSLTLSKKYPLFVLSLPVIW